ncbi:MAG: 16S rRNA (cytosine(1402)-N(4))-methyltransferase RsmH [Bacilli bacterium]|jgi:16S rRNA (cytosine1402-N4)-methyltransferase|nr:16S rRNA (cytosine(1402)-N(4))-methyltransferase RsmH [Bacilli bacterium]
MSDLHISVLLKEAVDGLNVRDQKTYLDLTLGRGGHSKEILLRLNAGTLIGIDQDAQAIEESKKALISRVNKIIIIKSNFVHLENILQNLKIEKVDGILMDLGVSSPQFDEGDRGFSYRHDALLDMRMDQKEQTLTASQIVNTYSLQELCKIFRDYGGEKFAYPIAKNIIKARPIETTSELVEIIKKSKPQKELKKIGHPAKQVFQALRIETNDELNVLKTTVETALKVLNPSGRLAIITFHSGEDKIVKDIFNKMTKVIGNRINIPDQNIVPKYKLITLHPLIPSADEIEKNHRAKSAKLRIIEKL